MSMAQLSWGPRFMLGLTPILMLGRALKEWFLDEFLLVHRIILDG